MEDETQFNEEVRTICKLYHQAQELHEQGIHLISVDEKTGIQAIELIVRSFLFRSPLIIQNNHFF